MPRIVAEYCGWRLVRAASFVRCVSAQRLMNASMVVILYEREEFSFEILSIPKENAVKLFAANCSNESLNEGM